MLEDFSENLQDLQNPKIVWRFLKKIDNHQESLWTINDEGNEKESLGTTAWITYNNAQKSEQSSAR